MAFDLTHFFKPLATLNLPSGPLYLYGLRTTDIRPLSKLPKDASAKTKVETLIVTSASRQAYDHESCKDPTRLTLEQVSALQDEEIEVISAAMLDPKNFNQYWAASKDSLSRLPAAQPEEAETNRVAAVVDWCIREESARVSKSLEAAKKGLGGSNALRIAIAAEDGYTQLLKRSGLTAEVLRIAAEAEAYDKSFRVLGLKRQTMDYAFQHNAAENALLGLGAQSLAAQLKEMSSARTAAENSLIGLTGHRLSDMLNSFYAPTKHLDRMLGLPAHTLHAALPVYAPERIALMNASFMATALFAVAVTAQPVLTELERLTRLSKSGGFEAFHTTSHTLNAIEALTKSQGYFPFVSGAVATTLADHWRADGLHEDLAGIAEGLGRLIDSEDVTGNQTEIDKLSEALTTFARKSKIQDAVAIFAIVLTLLIFVWQEHSSNQTEARLSSKIDAVQQQAVTKNEVAAIERLIVQSLKSVERPAAETVVFVVRERQAIVQAAPLSGSKVVGRLMANQHATLHEEDRQWILVEYFDFRGQEVRQGWVLKKYLKRQVRKLPAK